MGHDGTHKARSLLYDIPRAVHISTKESARLHDGRLQLPSTPSTQTKTTNRDSYRYVSSKTSEKAGEDLRRSKMRNILKSVRFLRSITTDPLPGYEQRPNDPWWGRLDYPPVYRIKLSFWERLLGKSKICRRCGKELHEVARIVEQGFFCWELRWHYSCVDIDACEARQAKEK